jgi:hypothetical protein
MDGQPFVFVTERRLVLLTGRNACNLTELLDHLREVAGSSVFYHTHHQFLAHHFERPMFHNDFSLWVSSALLEERLSEKLAALNLLAYTSVRQIRESMIAVMEEHLQKNNGSTRECVAGQQFHFCESQSFILPTGVIARDLPEFVAGLSRVSTVSLFFHFFEARLRLEHTTNDFSRWLSDRGELDLAQAIDNLDPYAMTLEELRQQIVRLAERQG